MAYRGVWHILVPVEPEVQAFRFMSLGMVADSKTSLIFVPRDIPSLQTPRLLRMLSISSNAYTFRR